MLCEARPFVVRAIAACSAAICCSVPAVAQEGGGEALASYALDFCAAVVGGQPVEVTHAAAFAGAELRGPQPAGDDVDLVGQFLQADRETPIFALGPPDDVPRILMAFVRADATRCAALAGRGDESLAALYARLEADGSAWKEGAAPAGGREFSSNANTGEFKLLLFAASEVNRRAASVVVERSDAAVASLPAEQLAAWAKTVVSQCAAAVHRETPPTAEAFVPFFKLAGTQLASVTLDGARDQPPGMLVLNPRTHTACVLAVGPSGVAELERALVDALLAVGATAQKSGAYRLRKPQGAAGRDAMFTLDDSRQTLLMSVSAR